MDEIKSAKEQIRKDVVKALSGLTEKQRAEKTKSIELRLFGFANFLEARIVLLYIDGEYEVRTKTILKGAYAFNKIVVLPAFESERLRVTTFKVDHPEKDLVPGPRGVAQPNPARCKQVPFQKIDIADILVADLRHLVHDRLEPAIHIGAMVGIPDRCIELR